MSWVHIVQVWRCPVDEGINGEWKEESSVSGFVAHQDWVRDVAWAPLTGIPSNMIASCGEDRYSIMWCVVFFYYRYNMLT